MANHPNRSTRTRLPGWIERPSSSDFGRAATYSLGDKQAAIVYYVSLTEGGAAHPPHWAWECANPHLVIWASGTAESADEAKTAAEAAIKSVLASLG